MAFVRDDIEPDRQVPLIVLHGEKLADSMLPADSGKPPRTPLRAVDLN